jgi:uncharacterized membrane protein YcaP (DUF421 family)
VKFFPEDWHNVFASEAAILEIIARGTALYFGLIILMRVMPRRMGGELATMDLVFILLIAQAAAHGLGGYTSIADGLFMIAVLIAWDWLLNFLSYRIPMVERLVSAPPIEVIRDGKLLRKNMRREYLTEDELLSHLRKEGVESYADVKRACIESDGRISVVPMSK